MSIDLDLLESLRSHRDDARGIEERFETLQLRTGWTLGVLSTPVGERREIGWVVCHSFGAEHWHLNATEVAIARALSRAGFPVLRFQSQGYGDSQHTDLRPEVATHLSDTIDAVTALRSLSGVRDIGLVGSRFGAAIATLAAGPARASYLALVDPAVSGRRYIRNLMRARAIVELTTGHPESQPTMDDTPEPADAIRQGGSINVRGFLITPDVYEGIAAVNSPRCRGPRRPRPGGPGLPRFDPEPLPRATRAASRRGPGPRHVRDRERADGRPLR